jgi:triphosphoribosyl-dephospho-CoA synthase
VHPGADFDDMTYGDMLMAAVAIGPTFEAAGNKSVGQTVLDAVRATRAAVNENANLGTILLVAPLAAVPRERPIKEGIAEVLARLDAEDARLVYEAIRLAQPGGLGAAAQADVAGAAPADLVAAMRLAADRDLVARQYTNQFAEVLGEVAPALREGLARGWPLSDAIVHAQIRVMSRHPDSLIARKCGPAVAQESAARAAAVLAAGLPGESSYQRAIADFDLWLRANGHRRNPGTTADLLAAGLFVLLRDGGV